MIYCGECGSRDVTIRADINANTWQVVDTDWDKTYCNRCDSCEMCVTEDRHEAAEARLRFRRETAEMERAS